MLVNFPFDIVRMIGYFICHHNIIGLFSEFGMYGENQMDLDMVRRIMDGTDQASKEIFTTIANL